MSVDFEVVERIEVESRDELAAALRRGRPVRLAGSGSAQHRLPAPGVPVTLLSTAKLDRVLRFEPDDLTCTVEPGVTRAELDRRLAAAGVRLPCPGEGTAGGIFARGEDRAPLPGAASTRGLLLGCEGVLADGTVFKVGSRVVKSVAGFDLPKLFVGSRGRLFAVTALHLRLRPLPAVTLDFGVRGGDPVALAGRFRALRRATPAPAALALRLGPAGAELRGRFEGSERACAAAAERAGVEVGGPAGAFDAADPPAGVERLGGGVRATAIPRLFEVLPAGATVVVESGGQFRIDVDRERSDDVLARLAALDIAAEIVCGTADRRGTSAPREPRVVELERRIRRALDHGEVLR